MVYKRIVVYMLQHTGLSTTDSATEQTTQQNETTSHHDIEYYSDSQSREKSESVTTRHSDQDDTTETSVVVISASNASTMRLTSDSAEKMTTPHTVTDAAGISRYYPANRVSMSEDQTRVELLRKQKREKPSLEDQSSNCGLELTSLRKHKDMSLESHDTTKKQKISSESASNSELHIDCDCGADQNL